MTLYSADAAAPNASAYKRVLEADLNAITKRIAYSAVNRASARTQDVFTLEYYTQNGRTLMPKIDWTLRAENVVKVLGIVLAVIVAWANMQSSLTATRSDVSEIKAELRELRSELTRDRERAVRNDARIEALEKDQQRQDREASKR
jgi:uncharacterized protein YbjQ (UPF0145 family)